MTPTRTITTIPNRRDSKVSFSNPPIGNDLPPTLSAPIGFRGILAEVRAPQPHLPVRFSPHESTGRKKTADAAREGKSEWHHSQRSRPMMVPQMATSVKDGGNLGTMTRGPFAGGRSTQITQHQWIMMSNVKVGAPHDGSSGRTSESGGNSGNASRTGSMSVSRRPSLRGYPGSQAYSRERERSGSRDVMEDYSDPTLTLQEELVLSFVRVILMLIISLELLPS